jgi:hypothetical protein
MKTAGLVLTFAAALGLFGSRLANASGFFTCQPTEVFEERAPYTTTPQIQIACSNAINGINYFAYILSATPTADQTAAANRLTAMASSAILAGRKMRLFIMDAPTQCQGDTGCRTITSWALSVP